MVYGNPNWKFPVIPREIPHTLHGNSRYFTKIPSIFHWNFINVSLKISWNVQWNSNRKIHGMLNEIPFENF